MKKSFTLSLISFICILSFAQKPEWQLGITPFFDNTEFGGSKVTHDQTIAGTRLSPEIGLCLDSVHRIHVGLTLMQEFGSKNTIDSYSPIAYYQFDKKPMNFVMGAFPREMVLKNYNRLFFQDSIAFYRPIMTGLFWEVYKKNNYFNVWVDWTGRQSETQREAFFIGWSGKYQKGIGYLRHNAYMGHYAKTLNAPDTMYINDNGLVNTAIGLDFSEKTSFEKLDFSIGHMFGLEDNRGKTKWLAHNALILEANIEYHGLGIFNHFYYGEKQMHFYNDEGNKLYWGDPVYRSKSYNRTDVYLRFIESERVKIKFVVSLHALEGKLYNEQGLYANVNFNNYKPKSKKKYHYLWDNWFAKKTTATSPVEKQ